MYEHRYDRAPNRILMLGTSPGTRGGISSVVKTYQSGGLFTEWPITYLSTHSDGSFVRKLLIAFYAWSSFVGRLIRRRDFLLHVHCASRASFWRKSAFILPALWMGRPVIFHLHGGGFMHFYEEDCGVVAKCIVRYILDHSSRIIVLSESWRKTITTITTNRNIVVIANPVLPIFDEGKWPCRNPRMLLFLGRLCRPKGIYVLLDALVNLIGLHPEVRLVCGGDGELDRVRLAANRLGLGDHVEVAGWVDESRKNELLATASIFVLPSFVEGLPMSILESMSAGLPIVATLVGGIPDVISDGDEGFLVPAGNSGALGEAIQKLLVDGELREAMGSRGRSKFDACFDVKVVLPQLESMYRELGIQPKGAG